METTAPDASWKRSGDFPRFLLFSTGVHSDGTATATLAPPERLKTCRLSQRASSACESFGAATRAAASKVNANWVLICSLSVVRPEIYGKRHFSRRNKLGFAPENRDAARES
jgi:hypothetical protein